MKTVDRIRKVAKKLFLERGFKKVSIREIAEKAEVPASSISYYFGSKKNLYHDVVTESHVATEISVREKIEESALSLFASKGYESVTIRDIAAAADVNSAAISYYFGGKKELYMAILQVGADILKRTQDTTDLTNNMPEFIIRHYMESFASLVVTYPESLRIMEWELIKTTDTFKQMWKSCYQPIFLEVYKAIQQGIKEGIFRKNLNPEGACILWISMMVNFFTAADVKGKNNLIDLDKSLSLEAYFESAADIFINGIKLKAEELL